MKTTDNPQSNINVQSLDDIIFAERNKAYGAFYLRKNYNKFIIKSFLFTTSLVCTIFVWSLLSSAKVASLDEKGPKNTGPFEMTKIPPSPTDPLPPIAPPAINRALVNTIIYAPPVVVDIVSTDAKQLSTIGDAIDGTGSDANLNVGPIGFGNGDGPGGGGPIIDDPDSIFVVLEEPATFQGDFRKWIADHIVYSDDLVNMRIEGKVFFKFIINKFGYPEDVQITRGVDPALDQEVIRVIKSSPRWTPGKQRGIPVKQLFQMQIGFQISQ